MGVSQRLRVELGMAMGTVVTLELIDLHNCFDWDRLLAESLKLISCSKYQSSIRTYYDSESSLLTATPAPLSSSLLDLDTHFKALALDVFIHSAVYGYHAQVSVLGHEDVQDAIDVVFIKFDRGVGVVVWSVVVATIMFRTAIM